MLGVTIVFGSGDEVSNSDVKVVVDSGMLLFVVESCTSVFVVVWFVGW